MKLPGEIGDVPSVKVTLVVAKEIFDGGFVVGKIAKFGGVFERELERFEGVIEAKDAQRAQRGAGGAQHGEDIGGGAEADIPDDEFARMRGHAFGQAELSDIKRLGFGDRADDGMKGLVFGERMNAVNAGGEPDDFITG